MNLDSAIIAANEVHDGPALVVLYQDASQLKREQGDHQASLFLLCQAYVFALENGHAHAGSIREKLKAAGREA